MLHKISGKYLLFFLFMGTTLFAVAQTPDKKAAALFNQGFVLVRNGDYAKAEKPLLKATERFPNYREAYEQLGAVYANLGQESKAISSYEKAYQANPQRGTKYLMYIGFLHEKLGNYKDAEKTYRQYLTAASDPESISRARGYIKQAQVKDSLVSNPIAFNPQNLGPEINTAAGEYAPTLRGDGQRLIFTRRDRFPNPSCPTPNGQTEDFFVADKKDGVWQKAKNMGKPLNTNCNEGAQSISADGQLMFFAAVGRVVKGREYPTSDIYWSRRKGDGWEEPINIGTPINTGSWESQPCISSDGKTLYFVRKIRNSRGGDEHTDIFYTTRNADNTWSFPVSIGDHINTSGDEFSPFIHPDNQTLYFASNKLPGMGGFDLFYVRRNADGSWGVPVNMGVPLNTSADEYSLVVSADGKTGYYASNTLKGYGDYDLYSFEIEKSARPTYVTYMKGLVTDASSNIPLEANFELINLKTGKTVISSKSDPVSGEFIVSIPAGNDYALNVSKEGYLFHSENFSLTQSSEDEPYLKNVKLNIIRVNEEVVLRNIFFETGSAELKPESYVELDKLVELLTQNPKIKIEIAGHTDNVGAKDANMKLSDQRAKSVSNYLESKGILSSRLTNKGYGDTKPVDDNNTVEGRANNRRTEFKITGIE